MRKHYEIIYKTPSGAQNMTGINANSAEEAKHAVIKAHPTWKIISVIEK